jgi:crotonobetainyl-CoA:carnitine CoA-transferase CaiB-like acyl-CoA transferase
MAGRPYEGIKIVEIASWAVIPGALAILSDWGADVIKIEEPNGGDPSRGFLGLGQYPFQCELAPIFEQDNRNKKSIALNLEQQAARDIVYELVKKADVFASNYVPKVLTKFALDYDSLAKINPRLIYMHVNGYGDKGADSERPGYDHNAYWARGGLGLTLGEPGAYPVDSRATLGDQPTAQMAAGIIMAALFAREKTGVAQKVSLALYNSAMWQLGPDIVACKLAGQPIPRKARLTSSPLSMYYKTKDDKWLRLCMPQVERFWSQFLKALGHLELENDPRFVPAVNRIKNNAELIAIVEEAFASETREYWGKKLDENGCIWGLGQTVAEIVEDKQAWDNEFLVELEHPITGKVTVVNSPGKFSKTPGKITRHAPLLGQHTEEILLEMGYSWDDLSKMKNDGAII